MNKAVLSLAACSMILGASAFALPGDGNSATEGNKPVETAKVAKEKKMSQRHHKKTSDKTDKKDDTTKQ